MKQFKPKHDTLIIQGFAPTTRELIPWERGDFDFAALNEEYNYPWMKKSPDLWFQMHPRWDFTRSNNMNHFNHPNWLFNLEASCIRCQGTGKLLNQQTKQFIPCPECEAGVYKPQPWRKDLTIVMQKAWKDIPGSVAFPLKEATELFGLGYPYFTSSVAMMLAYAYLVGYERVELYGFEMGTQTEYHYQRANGEFIMGFLKARGMEIYLPAECGILKGDLYGYTNMKTGFRQNLEMRHVVLQGQEQKATADVNRLTGQIQLLTEMAKTDPTLQAKLQEVALQFDKAKTLLSTIRGAMSETKNLTGMFDKYYLAGTEGGDLPSMEGFAAFTNVEYANE